MADPVLMPTKLDVAAASELATTLRGRNEPETVIDMADVKLFGALCAQVILSAAKSAESQNRTLSIVNVSDRVAEQMRLMGMTPETIARGCP
ncbi:MAG: STAS domain-containing protein [Roseobacter sp.]|jgi:chemotaxis protein CheX|nr:STAS domain-containing protein [Roseobacter sp.]